jgi:short-subunit dehydrogenase
VLVVGATSAIAEAAAREWAARGARLFLVARNSERLRAISADLEIRYGREVGGIVLDLSDATKHQAMLDAAVGALGEIETVLIAYGTLSRQDECDASADTLLSEFTTNALSVISLLRLMADYMARRGKGTIAVISSVAGDRGRQSNYAYGAAKAAVTVYSQGLRNRLHKLGIAVVTVKPGFVDTPMTRHISAKGLLWAKPASVGRGIVDAVSRGADVVYLPWFWRYIMLIIRLIPEALFKRLSL